MTVMLVIEGALHTDSAWIKSWVKKLLLNRHLTKVSCFGHSSVFSGVMTWSGAFFRCIHFVPGAVSYATYEIDIVSWTYMVYIVFDKSSTTELHSSGFKHVLNVVFLKVLLELSENTQNIDLRFLLEEFIKNSFYYWLRQVKFKTN